MLRSCFAQLLLFVAGGAAAVLRVPPAILKIQGATRELACTFLYSGIVRNSDPLELFDEATHQDWWFGAGNLSAALEDAARERTFSTDEPAPLPPSAPQKFNSPLLEARARRATPTARPLPGGMQPLPEPQDAEPIGPPTYATDRRGGANRGLCRQHLERVAGRRAELEGAILELLDPK
eukprot:4785590-Prymnesium_polylepis.4